MPKVKLILEYKGTDFSGWQVQPGQRTVQSELDSGLRILITSRAKLCGVENLNTPLSLIASGRTDSGVHARGQVISFFLPEGLELSSYKLKRSLNGILPKDIHVKSVEYVSDEFDARRNKHTKCYSYTLLLRDGVAVLDRGRVWEVSDKLDIASMASAAATLVGEHDFFAFRARDCVAKTTVRTIEVSQFVRLDAETCRYVVYGTGFLKQMVRIIVGTLVDIGRGRKPVDIFQQAMKNGSRYELGDTAPACGLCMEWVRYC